MNILALDTSAKVLTVAIQKNTYYEEYSSDNGALQHSQTLIPKITELCKTCNLNLKDIDLFICTRGPGSFTGLRIEMSALKGIAYATDRPIVSVSTLETIANRVDNYNGAVVAALDAKKQRYYLAAFEIQDGTIKRLTPDLDGTELNLISALEQYSQILVTGPDALAFAKMLDQYYKGTKIIETHFDENKTTGQSLIELGLKQYQNQGADDIGQGPTYLRKSDAEIALLENSAKNL